MSCRWLAALAAVAAASVTTAHAADFYAGKTITLLVGSEAGGGFDIYGRAIARHIARFIPGAPNVIVQNMPGAGGGRAAAFVSSVAPKDGTTIAALLPGTVVNPLLMGGPPPNYDATKLLYIGTADSGTRTCVTLKAAKTKTFEQALSQKTILGSTAAGSSTFDYAYLLKNAVGAKFEVISGYKNTAEITLAMERGEVDGACGWDWSSLRSQQPDFATKFNLILQTSLTTNAELDAMGVPDVRRFVTQPDVREMIELVLAQQVFGRPYVAPPETPPAQIAQLRAAFDRTVVDPVFLQDAERTRLQITPAPGLEVQALVTRIYASPRAIVERAKAAMNP